MPKRIKIGEELWEKKHFLKILKSAYNFIKIQNFKNLCTSYMHTIEVYQHAKKDQSW